jgi:hypothetical protein
VYERLWLCGGLTVRLRLDFIQTQTNRQPIDAYRMHGSGNICNLRLFIVGLFLCLTVGVSVEEARGGGSPLVPWFSYTMTTSFDGPTLFLKPNDMTTIQSLGVSHIREAARRGDKSLVRSLVHHMVRVARIDV